MSKTCFCLRKFAALGKPIIISTGLATLEDVLDAVRFLQAENDIYRQPEYLGILQCTSMYPIPFSDANLNVMHTLREATKVTVGYSDHTVGHKALEIAAAMGAEILEFHFTDTREGKTFRDHQVSLTRDDVHALINDLKQIAELKGSGRKEPVPIEIENGHVISFRRAVYPANDLEAGTILTEDVLTTLRPNHGIDARQFDQVLGKKLKTTVKAFQRLDWEILE